MPDPIEPEGPTLADLDDDALTAREAELLAEFEEARGAPTADEDTLTRLREIRDEIKAVRTEQRERVERAAEVARQIAEIEAELADEPVADDDAETPAADDDEDEDDVEVVEPEAETDTKPEAVAASAKTRKPALRSAATFQTQRAKPVRPEMVPERNPNALVAASPGLFPQGTPVTVDDIPRLIADKFQRTKGLPGNGENVPVVRFNFEFPEERQLGGNPEINDQRIREATALQNVAARQTSLVAAGYSDASYADALNALPAAGGLCAPLTPYYVLQQIGSTDRPVRDSLTQFQATRGGIITMPTPTITDADDAVGVRTAAQDASPTTADKPCLVVACGSPTSWTIEAISRCLQFGNIGSRAYPEQVQIYDDLTLVAHARQAENDLLTAMYNNSVDTTYAQTTNGAGRTLLPGLDQAQAAYRSRHRMGDTVPLHVWLPRWAKDMLRMDMTRDAFGYAYRDVGSVTDAEINAWFRNRNLNVTWFLDSPGVGTSQIFGAQTPGAVLTAFPTTMVGIMAHEGAFLFLDFGTLDLGIVRDSTLNATNDFQMFAETFEGLAAVGVQAIRIRFTSLCPTGQGPVGGVAVTC